MREAVADSGPRSGKFHRDAERDRHLNKASSPPWHIDIEADDPVRGRVGTSGVRRPLQVVAGTGSPLRVGRRKPHSRPTVNAPGARCQDPFQ